MEGFQMIDVIKALDIPRERFKDWLMRGYIYGSIYVEKGTRTFKNYSQLDVYRIALFKHLVQNVRIPREVAAGLILLLNRKENVEKKALVFFAPKREELNYEVHDIEVLIEYHKEILKWKNLSHVVLIPWGAIKSEVDKKLKELS